MGNCAQPHLTRPGFPTDCPREYRAAAGGTHACKALREKVEVFEYPPGLEILQAVIHEQSCNQQEEHA